MPAGNLSESFSAELDQIASSMSSGPDGSVVNLSRVAVDPMISQPAVRAEVGQPNVAVGEDTPSPLRRVHDAGMGSWLQGSSGHLEDLVRIRNGQAKNAVVITPALGVPNRRLAGRDPQMARDISSVRSTAGIRAVLGALGYSEEDAKRFIDERLPSARNEVYVTNEGGQVIVTGKVLDIPGKGSIHIQELAPQDYFMDSQVVFAPEGSRVERQTSTNQY